MGRRTAWKERSELIRVRTPYFIFAFSFTIVINSLILSNKLAYNARKSNIMITN